MIQRSLFRKRTEPIAVPRGAVGALCASILALPAAIAIAHDPYELSSSWVHHHTLNYTFCNNVNQDTPLENNTNWTRRDWNDGTILDFPVVECHPTGGPASHIQVEDANYGVTNWKASVLDSGSSSENAQYHATHTHLLLNINSGSNWSALTSYDKKAVICREIGKIVGIDRVYSSEWTAHGDDNDCMSFAGNPNNQTSKNVNSNAYTYTDSPGPHTVDLVDELYQSHGPDITESGELADALDVSPVLTAGEYDLELNASDQEIDGPGVEQLEVQLDGKEVAGAVQNCGVSGCDLGLEWTLSTVGLSAGTHAIGVIAMDAGGLFTEKEIEFELEDDLGAPPEIELSGDLFNEAGNVVGANDVLPLHAVATDYDTGTAAVESSGVVDLSLFVDEVLVEQEQQSCPLGECELELDWTFDSGAEGTGDHDVSIVATDAVGNAYGTDFVVAVGAPDTAIIAAPGSSDTASTVDFAFESATDGSTFQCKMDSGSWTSCSSPMTYNSLSNGSHTFSVKGTDPASNTTDATAATVTWSKVASTPTELEDDAITDEVVDAEMTNAEAAFEDEEVAAKYTASQAETDWCTESFDRKALCHQYRTEAGRALKAAEYLFTGPATDNTMSNSFQHAGWVGLMIWAEPDNRGDAWTFSRLHEGSKPKKSNPDGEQRRSSRADLVNNKAGFALSTKSYVQSRTAAQVCKRFRSRAINSVKIDPDNDPLRHQGKPWRLVRRKNNDSNGNPVSADTDRHCGEVILD